MEFIVILGKSKASGAYIFRYGSIFGKTHIPFIRCIQRMELYTNTKVIISKDQETNNTMPNNGHFCSTITNKNSL